VGEVAVRSTNLSCLSARRRVWNPDGVEGAVGVAEENDEEAADVRRCQVVQGVGNLGEVEGECELVLKVGVMWELVAVVRC
jgi:hypothetical protein